VVVVCEHKKTEVCMCMCMCVRCVNSRKLSSVCVCVCAVCELNKTELCKWETDKEARPKQYTIPANQHTASGAWKGGVSCQCLLSVNKNKGARRSQTPIDTVLAYSSFRQ